MATTTRDSIPGNSTEASAGNPRRTDAVGVEIPVVVHASRNSVAAREIAKPLPPVHEETRTVIVFPQGAVVRLTATVTAGELVVLTNQRSAADVLCRVVSVKTQPGIQNYVDLEFTQRAPGFWGDCFPSEHFPAAPMPEFSLPLTNDSFAPSLNKPAPVPVAPIQVTLPVAVARPQVSAPEASAPLPVFVAQPVPAPVVQLPVAAPVPVIPVEPPVALPVAPPVASAPTFATLPAARLEPEFPSASIPAAGVSSEGAMSLGLMRSPESSLAQTHSFDSPVQETGSRKTILLAVAAVVLCIVVGSAFVILHKSSSPSSAAQPAADVPPAPAASAAISKPLPVVPPQAAPAPAKQEAALAATPPSAVRSAPVVESPAPELPKSTPLPKQPSRNAVALAVGKLSAPMTKKPLPVSSADAPPILPASATAGSAGAGLLLGADQNSGPVSPATLARNTTLVGGRVLEPKLISSSSPSYPPQATVQRVQGDVVVDALVDARGRVTDAKAISGSPLLQQAAINAVRTWKYEPARLDGEAVPAHLQVKISFRLP